MGSLDYTTTGPGGARTPDRAAPRAAICHSSLPRLHIRFWLEEQHFVKCRLGSLERAQLLLQRLDPGSERHCRSASCAPACRTCFFSINSVSTPPYGWVQKFPHSPGLVHFDGLNQGRSVSSDVILGDAGLQHCHPPDNLGQVGIAGHAGVPLQVPAASVAAV